MTDFLSEIVSRKRLRLEDAQRERPLDELRARALEVRKTARRHALSNTLRAAGAPKVIAEIKRASPSKGVIKHDLKIKEVVRDYEQGGAAAISVLTEQDYFMGSVDDLREARAVTSIPILRKDFLFESYQIYESAEAGADALLLIVAALDQERLRELLQITQDELGMDALVEVHTSNELHHAVEAGAKLIGINNRDLRSFAVSLDVSVELARLTGKGWQVADSAVQTDVVLVSESGIKSGADMRRLQLAGFDGFLIGETLMRSEHPDATLRRMISEASTPRVKVCGITTLGDALSCVEQGADILGFNFYSGSPRYITPASAREIIDRLPPEVLTVGVFVNPESPQSVMRDAVHAGVGAVQLHGDESAEFCEAIKGVPVIKALRVGPEFTANTARDYPTSAVLLDAFSPNARGGTGLTFNWNLATQTNQVVSKLFLAGGLTSENVADAISRVKPFAVDVCSSVESSPGIKSEEKVKAFMKSVASTNSEAMPDARGRWGQYGGRYVPETLISPLDELTKAYLAARVDEEFQNELALLLKNYSGRPTPLTPALRLSEMAGGARIYLKREDLSHTGSHKINNALGQALLARRMGKRRVIAETGAGQHGVATATVCALFGLDCVVYMGAEDMRRQALNVFRMKLLGAEVREVDSGSRTLKDAINEAMRDWVSNINNTYYLLGSALGPHPYPVMVRDFQSVIGKETRTQILEKAGRLPDVLVACVGGGSNSIGMFYEFLREPGVRMIGVEAGGSGVELGQHAARFHSESGGRQGVLQGTLSYVLQDARGQISATHSISAGLDYPSIGPEHAYLHDQGRVEYVSVTDDEALEAFQTLSRLEGIIPALESAHAVAYAMRVAREVTPDQICVINLSGRGDKDVETVRDPLKQTKQ